MSIMQRMFGTNPAPAATIQQGSLPATGAPLAAVTNPATAPNGAIPVSGTPATTPAAASPVDALADLWKNDPNASSSVGQPLFNVDKTKLLETARQESFKEQVSQEQMAAIAAGGEQGFAAMMDIMNGMNQRAYAQSVHATTKLIDGALEKSNFARADELDTRIRNVQTRNSLNESNPVFSNPAFAPLLDSARNQFQVKYPTATAAELTKMTNDYVMQLVSEVNKPALQQQQQLTHQQTAGTDWSKFL